MPTMQCPQCGADWAPTDLFCPACGVTQQFLGRRLPPVPVSPDRSRSATRAVLLGLLVLGAGFMVARWRETQSRRDVVELLVTALARHAIAPELVRATVQPTDLSRAAFTVAGEVRAKGTLAGKLQGQWLPGPGRLEFHYELHPAEQLGPILYYGEGSVVDAGHGQWVIVGRCVAGEPPAPAADRPTAPRQSSPYPG